MKWVFLIVTIFLLFTQVGFSHEPYNIKHLDSLPNFHKIEKGPYNMWLLILDKEEKLCQVVFVSHDKLHLGRVYECKPPAPRGE